MRRSKLGVLVGGCLCLVVFMYLFIGTAWFQRWWKSVNSSMGDGLNRVVYVYDMAGNLVRTYEGFIDIQDTSYGNKVLFDLDGNRVVLYNCSVIVEEKSN